MLSSTNPVAPNSGSISSNADAAVSPSALAHERARRVHVGVRPRHSVAVSSPVHPARARSRQAVCRPDPALNGRKGPAPTFRPVRANLRTLRPA